MRPGHDQPWPTVKLHSDDGATPGGIRQDVRQDVGLAASRFLGRAVLDTVGNKGPSLMRHARDSPEMRNVG